MIDNKSRQTAALITLDVTRDITSKGWICMRSEEEAPYDLIVDMGLDNNKRVFATIQVKKDLRTTSRPNGGKGEPVAKNGKERNSYSYYDKDVTYLATVNNDGVVVYYHKDQYQYLTQKELRRVKPATFPVNDKMYSYRKPIETIKIDHTIGTLKQFIG